MLFYGLMLLFFGMVTDVIHMLTVFLFWFLVSIVNRHQCFRDVPYTLAGQGWC
uniref:Uncharacterized protein n=1 Tax=Anguilla anguilla TaxID=7936 RepID=A0A0E9S6R0_ANGAN